MKEEELKIFDELVDKYGEYIEMAEPDDVSPFLISLLCQTIIKERKELEYFKRRVKNVRCVSTTTN